MLRTSYIAKMLHMERGRSKKGTIINPKQHWTSQVQNKDLDWFELQNTLPILGPLT